MLRVVLMGVSGCGKSSVGAALSARLGVPYVDGDDLHPAANVAKMRMGTPLTDDDRWPWLDRVADVMAQQAPVIIGCSALRGVYRDRLRTGVGGTGVGGPGAGGGPVQFVHLAGSRAVIAARMAARTGHYMPTSLLDSQFAALEAPGPDEAIVVDIDQPLDAIVSTIIIALNGAQP